jgi:hypothetical protein
MPPIGLLRLCLLCLLCLLCALQPPSTVAVAPSSVVAARRFSDNHGGQELDPSHGRVGSFLGDEEEAGGVGP